MSHASCFTAPSRHALRALAAAGLFSLASVAHAGLPSFASFTSIGDVSNYTNPGVWEHHAVDVTSLVAGATNAQLSFNFANDLQGTGSTSTNNPTNAHLYFASDSAGYYLNFEFFFVPSSNGITADSSAHMRDVKLVIDGQSFGDQYGAFNAGAFYDLQGTAIDGWGDGVNITGQTGFEARTYVMATGVPEPETYALMLAGLGALGFVARRRRVDLND